MPRRNSSVKRKHKSRQSYKSIGLVDLHFHGAFGIDLMRADAAELTRLANELWMNGIAAFCPTTISAPREELGLVVARLGAWIQERQKAARSRQEEAQGALPLGIHLEGPFIHPESAGAHPPGVLRPLSLTELEELWEKSRQTLKIITLAPETLEPATLKEIARWCKKRSVVLSLGHSRATHAQASAAFDAGVRGVTHAWNALPFHHRAPGALGAALGRKDIYVELIPDGVHVDPVLIRWTRKLHPPEKTCFVSDCVPAAGTTPGTPHSFGPLEIHLEDRSEGIASRLPNGALAGGGQLLSESYSAWVRNEARLVRQPLEKIFKESLIAVTQAPLEALPLPPALRSLVRRKQVKWALPRCLARPGNT